MDADLDDTEYGDDPALRGDLVELFDACANLGRTVEEFDAASQTTHTVFRRHEKRDGERWDWREALRAVKSLLKRYDGHTRMPVRRALASLRVMSQKLLPMLTHHHDDQCVARARAWKRAARRAD
jgi:hypothetical protein